MKRLSEPRAYGKVCLAREAARRLIPDLSESEEPLTWSTSLRQAVSEPSKAPATLTEMALLLIFRHTRNSSCKLLARDQPDGWRLLPYISLNG